MLARLLAIAVFSTLMLSGCGRESPNSDGNGPGNADGFGGRRDPSPPAEPAANPDADRSSPAEAPPADNNPSR